MANVIWLKIIVALFLAFQVRSNLLSCFESHVAYSGIEIGNLTNINSSSLCQQACQNELDCNFFRFNLTNNTCFLLTTVLHEDVSAIGIISGSKFCNTGCFETHTDFKGVDLTSQLFVGSAADCQRRCQKKDGCSFFTYNHLFLLCVLKSSVYIVHTNTFLAPLSTSGPKFCSGGCFQANTIIGGSDTIIESIKTTSVFGCQDECQKNVNCTAFTFAKNVFNTTCQLQSKIDLRNTLPRQLILNTINPFSLAGLRFCNAHCLEEDTLFLGNTTSSSFNVTSVEECQRGCQVNSSCSFFTFSSDLKICQLMNFLESRLKVANNTSGPKFC